MFSNPREGGTLINSILHAKNPNLENYPSTPQNVHSAELLKLELPDFTTNAACPRALPALDNGANEMLVRNVHAVWEFPKIGDPNIIP